MLREHAWVTLCSGFRESVVRKVFGHISLCFCDWESAKAISAAGPACVSAASASFRNLAKLRAILSVAQLVHRQGFGGVKRALLPDPIGRLQALPFIGPVTSLHLAKNLGLNVAKPDRHLARVAAALGFANANDLCVALADRVGESVKVIDLMLWRYLADNPTSLRSLAGEGNSTWQTAQGRRPDAGLRRIPVS